MLLTVRRLARIPGYGPLAELADTRADDHYGTWVFLPIPRGAKAPPAEHEAGHRPDTWMREAGLSCVVGVLEHPHRQNGHKVADRITIWAADRAEAIRCPDDAIGILPRRESRFCFWHRRGALADVIPALSRLTPPGLPGAPGLQLPLPPDLWTPGR